MKASRTAYRLVSSISILLTFASSHGGVSICGFIFNEQGNGVCRGAEYPRLYERARKVADSQCSSRCPGAQEFGLPGACGTSQGRNIAVYKIGFGDYKIPSTVTPIHQAQDIFVTVSSLTASPLGCFSQTDRLQKLSDRLPAEHCMSLASSRGFRYSGVGMGGLECYGTNAPPEITNNVDISECNMPCRFSSAFTGLSCGGTTINGINVIFIIL